MTTQIWSIFNRTPVGEDIVIDYLDDEEEVQTDLDNIIYTSKDDAKLAKYPYFADYSNRYKSFILFPKGLNQKTDELAKSGLFYTDQNDHCKCFSCGGMCRLFF